MKTNQFLKTSFIFLMSVALIASCEEEPELTQQDSTDVAEEAVSDSYFQDLDDMAGVAIQAPSDQEFSGGRGKNTITITVNDSRFRCDGSPLQVTLSRDPNSTLELPIGSITLDFGVNGCTDLRGNVRTGKLTFAYRGRRFSPGSTITTTPENYSINGVKIEGTRTMTNVSGSNTEAPKFNTVLTGGKATFTDGSIALRESDHTWSWVRGATPADDILLVDVSSTASGTTRGGRKYEVSLQEELTYKRFCGIAVSGIKRLKIEEGREILINYGDGACDRDITVTVNGISRQIRVE